MTENEENKPYSNAGTFEDQNIMQGIKCVRNV